MPDGPVAIDADHAETVLEAAGTLVDDIANGREWGHDEDAHEENAADLDAAYTALRDALDGDTTRVYRTRMVSRDFQESDEGMNTFADPDEAKAWLEGYARIRYDAEPSEWHEEQSADEKWSMSPVGVNRRAVVMGTDVRQDADELLDKLEEACEEVGVGVHAE